MSEENEPEDLEKPEHIIDEIDSCLDNMHGSLVDAATHVGYARDAFRAARPVWEALGNASTNDPDAASIYSSGIDFLKAHRDELRSKKGWITSVPDALEDVSASANYLVTASETTASYFPEVTHTLTAQDSPTFSLPDQHRLYVERLSQVDPQLGQTYQEMWETLYGTRADPERPALYLMRQAFDHLFAQLAPDDEVRQSPYWTPKEEKGMENQIWRRERIEFAANTRIKDPARRNTLLASARNMLVVYKSLNAAHQRGELDPTKARRALAQMRAFVEDWTNAVLK